MTISFIIPVYNCKEYLPNCVNSIRTTGFEHYEILLIDDGSTDGSGAVCDDLAAKFSEIRVIHQSNAGVSAARNRGISESHGDYILFVDADDTLTPFSVSVMDYLNAQIDMVIFGMEFRYYHHNQRVRNERKAVADTIRAELQQLPGCFAGLFAQNYLSSACNKFFKRTLLLKHHLFFDARLTNYEDLAFTLQVLSKCANLAAVPDVNYLYCVDYDHDRTVDRIAKIDDIIGNTDIIAESFVQLESAIYAAGGEKTDALKTSLRNIYFELFGVKMKTAAMGTIKRYCRDFANNRYIKTCIDCVGLEPGGQSQMYNWICQENTLAIWLKTRYSMLRHFAARNIKRITGWRLS